MGISKWEYRTVAIVEGKPYTEDGKRTAFQDTGWTEKSWLDYLRHLGDEGWDLFAVTHDNGGEPRWMFFKRPIGV